MGRPCYARLFFGCGVFAACAAISAAEASRSAAPLEGWEQPQPGSVPGLPEANGPIRASLERIDVLETGTSDRKALKAAKAAVPLNRLSPGDRRRAEAVLGDLSMFRKMPTLRLEVDHDAYRYFVEHPDVAVS